MLRSPTGSSGCCRCSGIDDRGSSGKQVVAWWRRSPYRECFLLNKLLTGELRVGVSELLVTRALAELLDLPRAISRAD